MNAVFHLVSAATAGLLVYLLLRAQKQLRFVRELLLSQQQRSPQRVQVDAPLAFLSHFATVLGIEFSNEAANDGAPARLEPKVWTEVFLSHGIQAIRCGDSGVELSLQREGAEDELCGRLARALGGQIVVRVKDEG